MLEKKEDISDKKMDAELLFNLLEAEFIYQILLIKTSINAFGHVEYILEFT